MCSRLPQALECAPRPVTAALRLLFSERATVSNPSPGAKSAPVWSVSPHSNLQELDELTDP